MGLSWQEYWNGLSCHSLLQGILLTRDRTLVSCSSCIGRQSHGATWEDLLQEGLLVIYLTPLSQADMEPLRAGRCILYL